MILAILAVITGLCLLVMSADKFVDSAASIAYKSGLSPLVVGITVVAFGTSAPEIVISTIAAWSLTPNIAIGNAIGSNIANIGLVLGITALLIPLPFNRSLLRVEIPILIIGSLVAGILLIDLTLGMIDGMVLLVGLAISLYILTQSKSTDTNTHPIPAQHSHTRYAYLWLIMSIIVMTLGARILVWGATNIATSLGVSDLIIGLTIVAIGTSLPELATSIASVYKQQYDIAIGNIIGSNTFNLLAVMAIPGLIHPATLPSDILWRDYGMMLILTFALLGLGMMAKKRGAIGRIKGILLFTMFIGYNFTLYLTA